MSTRDSTEACCTGRAEQTQTYRVGLLSGQTHKDADQRHHPFVCLSNSELQWVYLDYTKCCKNNYSLEFLGTLGLSYVITLQRQLPTHDLDQMLRKQTCERSAYRIKPTIGNLRTITRVWTLLQVTTGQVIYLQAQCCLNSEPSWYCSRHCRCFWPLQDTAITHGRVTKKDNSSHVIYKSYSCALNQGELSQRVQFVILIEDLKQVRVLKWVSFSLTWIFMATSLPSLSRAKCTWPMDAAAKGLSSKYSSLSLQFGPRSLLMAFYRDKKQTALTHWHAFDCKAPVFVFYHHLFGRHEVRALSNSLKDFGQLWVNEGVVWKRKTSTLPLHCVRRTFYTALYKRVLFWDKSVQHFLIYRYRHSIQTSKAKLRKPHRVKIPLFPISTMFTQGRPGCYIMYLITSSFVYF